MTVNYCDMMRYPATYNGEFPGGLAGHHRNSSLISSSVSGHMPHHGAPLSGNWSSSPSEHHSHRFETSNHDVMFRRMANNNNFDQPNNNITKWTGSVSSNNNSNMDVHDGNGLPTYKYSIGHSNGDSVMFHNHCHHHTHITKAENDSRSSSPGLELMLNSVGFDEYSWSDSLIQPLVTDSGLLGYNSHLTNQDGGGGNNGAKETPDDDRLVRLLLQLGIHRLPVLPDLRLHENELDLYTLNQS